MFCVLESPVESLILLCGEYWTVLGIKLPVPPSVLAH